jgi:F-type H+-transporting ATPase subunit epsilon
MASTFRLAVLTPQANVFEGVVEKIEAPGCDGEFGVMPGHYAYITSVRPGVLHFSCDGEDHTYAVGHGFAQVSAEKVSVVVSSCEDIASIDVAEAYRMLAAAEATLLEVGPGGEGYSDALVEQELASGRILAVEHSAPAE